MTSKSLAQWLEFISSTHPSEIEMGLERVKTVYNALNLNTSTKRIVLVAGTNGKGSTVAMMEAGLLALGFKVGAYTSPHILTYNERVRKNGIFVDDSALVQAFDRVEYARQQIPLTYFEYGTLAALDLLFTADLDVVLLEIGLGGRLDAVNIVEPDISVITSVGIDHSDWLGNTIEEIGAEKAGILRNNSLFIGGEKMPASVLQKAESLASKSLLLHKHFDENSLEPSRNVCLEINNRRQDFCGFPSVLLPANNILISLQAVASIQSMLDKQTTFDQKHYIKVVNAIEKLTVPGRLEKLSNSKIADVYLDVGHNPDAALYLKTFLQGQLKSGKQIQIVYSSLIDKNALGVLEILSPIVERCLLAPLKNERAMPLDSLKGFACSANLREVLSFSSIDDAITDALNYALNSSKSGKSVLTLIFGSFYMVEAAKRFFETYD